MIFPQFTVLAAAAPPSQFKMGSHFVIQAGLEREVFLHGLLSVGKTVLLHHETLSPSSCDISSVSSD